MSKNKILYILMKSSAINTIQTLQKKGFTTYFAGGCVRDMLMGKTPSDFDIATSASPEEIEKNLEKTIPIGKSFGVILTHLNGHNFEIATFRREGEYIDGRRPSTVDFCNPEEDAKRRDFTINGIFYDPINDKIYDFVEGQKDLQERLIKFIGNPEKRIEEDHLRIIRAIRFKNLLEFQYDPETYKALKKNANLSAKVSGERLRDELNKMIDSPFMINCLKDMDELGILAYILPEFEEMHGVAQPFFYHTEGDVFEHSLKSFASLKKDASKQLKWATLLHDIAKSMTYSHKERIRFDEHTEKSKFIIKNLLKRLAFSKKDIDHITWLTSHHMMLNNFFEMPKGRLRHWFLHPWFPELLELFRADIAGTKPSDYSLFNRLETLYEDFFEHIETKNKELKPILNGNEIIEMIKIKEGPKLGEIIDHLREKQLLGEIKTKNEAKEWILKFYKN